MLEIIFRSCLGSRPKLPHIKGSLINSSIKGIKITHVFQGILRPKIHQDQTGKLYQNVGREQDRPLPLTLEMKVSSLSSSSRSLSKS